MLPDVHRMTGVMPALVARHDVEPVGEEIDNLPLALVSPLGSQDDDVCHVVQTYQFSAAPRFCGDRALEPKTGVPHPQIAGPC